MVCVEKMAFLKACDIQNEILKIQNSIMKTGFNATKHDLCDLVCELTEPILGNCKSNSCPINILFVVNDQTYSFAIDVTDRKTNLVTQITCEIIAADCVNNTQYNCDGSSPTSSTNELVVAQHTTSAYVSDDTIQNITKDATSITRVTSQEEGTSKVAISQTDNVIALTTKTTEETTSTPSSPLPASTSQENTSITTRKYETVPQASAVRECSSNSGLIVGAAFIGLFAGVFATGPISIFLYKRWASPNKRRAIFNSLYKLNEPQTTVRPTVGDTYNEIENEPQSPKISYVLPITKEQTLPSIKTNDPEIYHHLREDYAVKDRSNYYDHAMPLNGPQEEHYGKLTNEENGAYSTVTNTNKTGPDPVRNEAYSTIETNEFQLVDLEDNSKDSNASYFVLVKD